MKFTGKDPATGFKFQLDLSTQVDKDLVTLNAVGKALMDAGYTTDDKFHTAMATISLSLFGRERALAVGERLMGLVGEREAWKEGLS